MSDLFWLTDAQMERLKPFFPVSHGVPRVDDKRVLSGIIFVNRNGLRWRDAPADYGPHKTLYNRWFRWSQKGVFARILLELVILQQMARLSAHGLINLEMDVMEHLALVQSIQLILKVVNVCHSQVHNFLNQL